MPTDIIRYDLLVQEALRGVVRKVLADAARDGLPGDHNFYITFRTDAPGVRISPRTREKFPEEITIILQHQFWDLEVTDTGFQVGLSFSNVPELLTVPFDAIRGFFDPSVQFGLKFEVQDMHSMGDIVNLRQFRKSRRRKQDEAQADINRIAFGRTKIEREISTKERMREERRIDGHKLDSAEPGADD